LTTPDIPEADQPAVEPDKFTILGIRVAPLTHRRWVNFRANKRGYWAFRLFIVFFGLTLMAELIANDKPILLQHDGSLYFSGPAPIGPTKGHWFGTDDASKDVLANLIYGARLSFIFGIALTFFSSIIGVTSGAIQGYFGGKVDLIAQRFIEVWSGLPTLFILIILSSIIESNVFWLLIILIAFSWMALVGVVRAEFLRARNFQYVTAARALGASDARIMVKHVLPNAMVATITFLPFILTGSITLLTSLDFLGFGLPSDAPSLGRLLAQGRANLHAPWLGLTTFFTLATMLTLLIFIGEAVRDAFDPRKSL
jgi:microcin C transport system permease protein